MIQTKKTIRDYMLMVYKQSLDSANCYNMTEAAEDAIDLFSLDGETDFVFEIALEVQEELVSRGLINN